MNQDIVHRMAEKKRVGIFGRQAEMHRRGDCMRVEKCAGSQPVRTIWLFGRKGGQPVSPVSKLRFPTDGY